MNVTEVPSSCVLPEALEMCKTNKTPIHHDLNSHSLENNEYLLDSYIYNLGSQTKLRVENLYFGLIIVPQ